MADERRWTIYACEKCPGEFDAQPFGNTCAECGAAVVKVVVVPAGSPSGEVAVTREEIEALDALADKAHAAMLELSGLTVSPSEREALRALDEAFNTPVCRAVQTKLRAALAGRDDDDL